MTTTKALNKIASEEGYTDFIVLMANSNIGFITDRVEKAMIIYAKSVLAEIVEDVPEYVECIKADVSIKLGNIYKVKSQNSWDGILNNVYYLEGFIAPYYCKNFKPSTKEAFDLQNPTKEMTITLDGDVVNISHWSNNVKIVYK